MPWTSPATATVGQVYTAAYYNQHTRDNLKEVWREFAYVEWTTASIAVGTSPTDIVSAGSLTFDGTSKIAVELFVPATDDTGGNLMSFELHDGTSLIGRVAYVKGGDSVVGRRVFTPAAGTRTYKIQARTGFGTYNVYAGSGGAATHFPGYIRLMSKGG